MEQIGEFIQFMIEFYLTGIYDLVKSVFAYFLELYALMKLQFMITTMQFAYDVAIKMMSDLGVSQIIAQSLAGIDSKVLNILLFFRVFEALNIILSAFITRFVMQMMGTLAGWVKSLVPII